MFPFWEVPGDRDMYSDVLLLAWLGGLCGVCFSLFSVCCASGSRHSRVLFFLCCMLLGSFFGVAPV
jgi:hypothetical protein